MLTFRPARPSAPHLNPAPVQALTAVSEAVSASLYEMATSKYGSFVVRRLLCVLSGRDVAPAPNKKGGGGGAGGSW